MRVPPKEADVELRDDPSLADLLARAAGGDQQAWGTLVERYIPLVFSVARKYPLSHQDVADVSQTLWLRLVEKIATIREPEALAAWIITTTKREALHVVAAGSRTTPVDPTTGFEKAPYDGPETDAELLRVERHQALRDGLALLRPEERELMLLLIADPRPPYAEIARRLGISVGSIGPTRGRCLEKLRATAGLERLLTAEGGDCNDLART
jgi:RNA polymerase sigma factor (sigma-70 family)